MSIVWSSHLIDPSVTGIALDEYSVYWSDGSTIYSKNLSSPSITEFFTGDNIVDLLSVSPGQQPQYCKFQVVTFHVCGDMYVYSYTCIYMYMHNNLVFVPIWPQLGTCTLATDFGNAYNR